MTAKKFAAKKARVADGGVFKSGKPAWNRNTADDFWSRVDRDVPEISCWLWTSGRSRLGYGVLRWGGKMVRAHRLSWELTHGPIADGLVVLHACDTNLCVNPAHLSVGTGKDNQGDAARKGRMMRGERHTSSKLTEDDVRSIRAQLAAGASLGSLCRAFRVSMPVIAGIRDRKGWAWLDPEDGRVPT